MAAPAEAVARGMRISFAIAAGLIVLALAIAVSFQAGAARLLPASSAMHSTRGTAPVPPETGTQVARREIRTYFPATRPMSSMASTTMRVPIAISRMSEATRT